ncbi:MAG: hypothetical protein AAF465_03090 [Pseudomonadota bacterium]
MNPRGFGLVAVFFAVTWTLNVFASELPPEIIIQQFLPENGGTGADGVFIDSDQPCNQVGFAVSSAGDFNGDGIEDFVVSAPNVGCILSGGYGDVFVVFGTATGFPPYLNIRDLLPENGGDGSQGIALRGRFPYDYTGYSVDTLGDFNGDGIDDIAIGEPFYPYLETNTGAVYVLYGSAAPFAAHIELESLLAENGGDGSIGFVVFGHKLRSRTGETVRGAGDVNGDGLGDLLVSAHRAEVSDAEYVGHTYLLFGSASTFPPSFFWSVLDPQNGGDGSQGVIFKGNTPGGKLGIGIDAIGDFNGDGLDDIAIGQSQGGNNPDPIFGNNGRAFLIFGSTDPWPAEFDPDALLPSNGGDGSSGVVFDASSSIRALGFEVSQIGDFNGDGLDDIALNAIWDSGESTAITEFSPDGIVYVVFGEQGYSQPVFDVTNLAGVNGGVGDRGFVVHPAVEGHYLGRTLSGGDDIDGDGLDDLLISSLFSLKAYLLYGTNTDSPSDVFVSSLLIENGGTGEKGVVIKSQPPDGLGHFGEIVGMIGDINNDGLGDLAVSDLRHGDSGFPDTRKAGSLAVVFGKPKVFIDPDQDQDGVPNQQDNCTLAHNPQQQDADGDGYGNVCDADFDNNCVVNFLDYATIAEQFLTSSNVVDLNSDGVVNFTDISLFANLFLQPVGPSGSTFTCLP